jgi:prephenate dehydrogenase
MASENDSSFTMETASVGVIGLGLMGGSLALGLAGKVRRRIGLDSDPKAGPLALEKNVVDEVALHLVDLVVRSDLIVLATPVRTILATLRELSKIQISDDKVRIVIDIGSTKADILKEMDALGDRYDPIGGHPICGREVQGVRFAEPALYKNATFVLSPASHTSPRALAAGRRLAELLGAHPLELAAADHDRLIASTSHLPFLAALALVQTAIKIPSAATLAGSGFRDTSRLASSNLEMMADILLTNRGHILQALEDYTRHLEEIAKSIREEDEAHLKAMLAEGRRARQELIGPSAPEGKR